MIPSAPGPAADATRPAWWRVGAVLLRVLVAGGLLALALRGTDLGDLAQRVRAAPWWTLSVPAVLLLLNSAIHGLRLWLLVPAPRPAWSGFFRAVLVGNFFGLFLPTGGGDAAKVLALSPLAGGLDRALGMLAVTRSLELLPWALLLFWGALGVLPGRLDALIPLAWLAGGAMVAVHTLAVLAMRDPEAILSRLPGPLRGETLWAGRVRRFATVRVSGVTLVACQALAVPFALTNCLASWVVLRGYGAPIGYLDVCGLIPTLDVVIAAPITVSGVGVRETMYVMGLAAWSVPAEAAFASGSTRWAAELLRCLIGAIWWLRVRVRPQAVAEPSPSRARPEIDRRAEGEHA
jgi:hypothetical protein